MSDSRSTMERRCPCPFYGAQALGRGRVVSAADFLDPVHAQPADPGHAGTDKRAQIVVEGGRDAVAGLVDEGIFHYPRFRRDRGERGEAVIDRIVADPLDGYRSFRPGEPVLHGAFADLARLALVDLGHAARKRALQIAERIAARPLDAKLFDDFLAQEIGQRPGAGKLHIAMRIALDRLGEPGDDRFALSS